MATPAAGAERSTPASIRAMDPPHTEAMDEEPLDSRTSEKIQAWSLLAPSILKKIEKMETIEGQIKMTLPLLVSVQGT